MLESIFRGLFDSETTAVIAPADFLICVAAALLIGLVTAWMYTCRTLHITIPEDLDYTGVFDGLLRRYAAEYELTQVKTTNMGSLFRLTYNLTLRSADVEKSLIDELRCRNGNLEITISKQETAAYEL